MKAIRYLYLTLIFAFLLGNCDGYIALWRDTNTTPVRIFPYRIEMLPESDQQALERGIPITDEQELIRLLEDYLS